MKLPHGQTWPGRGQTEKAGDGTGCLFYKGQTARQRHCKWLPALGREKEGGE